MKAGATTLAYVGVREEMIEYEPTRWRAAAARREDVRALNEPNVQLPSKVFSEPRFVLKDGSREVDFLHLGWGHTRGDGYVWLPEEHILCTGDAAVNGPRNKMWDANVANWPNVLDKATALRPSHSAARPRQCRWCRDPHRAGTVSARSLRCRESAGVGWHSRSAGEGDAPRCGRKLGAPRYVTTHQHHLRGDQSREASGSAAARLAIARATRAAASAARAGWERPSSSPRRCASRSA